MLGMTHTDPTDITNRTEDYYNLSGFHFNAPQPFKLDVSPMFIQPVQNADPDEIDRIPRIRPFSTLEKEGEFAVSHPYIIGKVQVIFKDPRDFYNANMNSALTLYNFSEDEIIYAFVSVLDYDSNSYYPFHMLFKTKVSILEYVQFTDTSPNGLSQIPITSNIDAKIIKKGDLICLMNPFYPNSKYNNIFDYVPAFKVHTM
jgi:hypothetical protein